MKLQKIYRRLLEKRKKRKKTRKRSHRFTETYRMNDQRPSLKHTHAHTHTHIDEQKGLEEKKVMKKGK